MNAFTLFAGTSHPAFAEQIAGHLGCSLGKVLFQPFPDREIYVQIQENVRGRDVFVIQTIAGSPNYYLMELLIMIDALKRASARSIVAVIPYFGYSRQDRKDKPRTSITGKLVSDLIATAGATQVLTMDLHAEQIQAFFNIPVDNLYARPVLADAIQKLGLEDLVIMAPDLGAIKIAHAYASHLKQEFAVIDKKRISSEKVEISAIIGDVKGRNVLLVDDMCSTGNTLKEAAIACKKAGAKKIIASFSHGLLVGNAVFQLDESPIEKIFVSDTIPLPENAIGHSKFEVVSVADLFGEAIRSILTSGSLSSILE